MYIHCIYISSVVSVNLFSIVSILPAFASIEARDVPQTRHIFAKNDKVPCRKHTTSYTKNDIGNGDQ